MSIRVLLIFVSLSRIAENNWLVSQHKRNSVVIEVPLIKFRLFLLLYLTLGTTKN